MRGVFSAHEGRFSFRDPIDQLHNIFIDMLLRKITMQFVDVWKKPLIADVLMLPFYSGAGSEPDWQALPPDNSEGFRSVLVR